MRVVQAMEHAESEGRASTSLDGIMIDTPVYTRCKQLLQSEKLLN
jgi:citrate lyase beta subunit